MGKGVKIYRSVLVTLMLISIVSAVYLVDDLTEDNNKEQWNIDSKDVNEAINSKDKLIPMGIQIGVYLETEGVLVANVSKVTGSDGMQYSPADNKIRSGDYIIKLNGIDVGSKSQLLFLVNKYGNNDIILTIKRNNEQFDVKVTPIKTDNAEYKMGIWVRDDTQGIGTMTFMTEDGYFGALGHGISDIDTKKLLDSNNGLLYYADIWSIKKGASGTPGSLCGSISYEEEMELGVIYCNTSCGIFGRLHEDKMRELIDTYNMKAYPVGKRNEVKEGKADILSAISGEIKEYEIYITKVNKDSDNNKGMIIKVTDEELLRLTNGIVQGMSGSPIVQDGKIIGAVTHVFVNDPAKGYGIFIEEMMGK